MKQHSFASEFIKIASKYSAKNALFCDDKFYTYAEFSNIVSNIQQELLNKFSNHSLIAILDTNDVYTYAAALAVTLSGKAYIPLNPRFPADRNQLILRQAYCDIILSGKHSKELKELINEETYRVLITAEINNKEQALELIDLTTETAYIIFTSGTTGIPKGVPVSHSNLNSFFNFFIQNEKFKLNANDNYLQVYDLNFDVSVFSFFLPMLTGGCCYILPKSGIAYLNIAKYLQEYPITVLSMVPSVLTFLKPHFSELSFPQLRLSFFSGDILWQDLAEAWSKVIPNAEIINCYGPTETTIVCTWYPWDKNVAGKEAFNGIVPIGKSFLGMDFIIIDEEKKEVGKGELCFTGSQVIKQYLNKKSEEKFFDFNGKRFYRTGDLVSRNESNNLLFHGRVDHQVKVSGYRVELNEIEFQLGKITGMLNAVICIKGEQGESSLIAFIETDSIKQEWIEKLKSKVPFYMIPKKLIPVEKMPYNSNGKIEREKLKAFL